MKNSTIVGSISKIGYKTRSKYPHSQASPNKLIIKYITQAAIKYKIHSGTKPQMFCRTIKNTPNHMIARNTTV